VARLDTLESEADLAHCELIAKGRVGTTPRGWRYQGAGSWKSDLSSEAALTRIQLIALASSGHELTVTGVPVGSGQRMGLDRDRDRYLDADELLAGTNPGDPASHPLAAVPTTAPPVAGLYGARPNPFRTATTIDYVLAPERRVRVVVIDGLGRSIRVLIRDQRVSA